MKFISPLPRQLTAFAALGLLLLCPSAAAVDYYVDAVNGNDSNAGTSEAAAWRTISKVNDKKNYAAGDTINFRSGQTFTGAPLVINNGGTVASPILIRAYGGDAQAIIEATAANANGITISAKSNVRLQNLHVRGPWQFTGTGSTTPIGIHISGKCDNIQIDRVRVSNFAGFGIRFETTQNNVASTGFRLTNSEVHDTGHDGVQVVGRWNNDSRVINHTDVYIAHVKAHRCKGFDSQDSSGNGIRISQVDGGVIEYCEANFTGSGWGGKGGGPIGIWSWDSNNVIIQYSYSHNNKNGAGTYDWRRLRY